MHHSCDVERRAYPVTKGVKNNLSFTKTQIRNRTADKDVDRIFGSQTKLSLRVDISSLKKLKLLPLFENCQLTDIQKELGQAA